MVDLRKPIRRLTAFFTRGRRDDELHAEIRQHIDMRCQQLIDDGMDPRDAAYEARRMFGNATRVREDVRDLWSVRWLESLAQDFRFGARVLVRTPLFTTVAVLSLAAGIGAAVAVFNVADAVLFRRLPVLSPEELRAFRMDIQLSGATKTVNGVPEYALAGIQRDADFADVIGFRLADDVTVGGGTGSSRMVRVEFVSANYFEVLGLAPSSGRLLTPSDFAGSPLPVVISERLWESEFARDPRVPGRTLQLNGHPTVVVGVADGFRGLSSDRPADLFAPLPGAAAIDPTQSQFSVTLIGRMHPGTTTAEAEAKLASLCRVALRGITRGAPLRATLSDASRGVASSRDALEQPLWLGLGLVAALLMTACANTGALLLSRLVTRQAEFGIRVAMGAGMWRLVRQLIVEALLVGVAAAGVGLLAGWLSAPLLLRLMPAAGTEAAFDLRFDARLIGFALCLAPVCAVAAAAASLFRLWRADASALLHDESRSAATRSHRLTSVLIAAQVACSLLLVVGAVSMGRTLVKLRSVPLGFDTDRLLLIDVNAGGLAPAADMSRYHAALHEKISALRGVARATMAQLGVLTSAATTGTIEVPGYVPQSDQDRIARVFFVGPGYFDTMGMPIVAGTGLDAIASAGSERIAVINERFAKLHFGSAANAIGRTFNRDVRIVGVAADAHYSTPRDEPIDRAMFVPFGAARRPAMTHIVRLAAGGEHAIAAIGAALTAHDSRLRPKFLTSEDAIGRALARERFFAAIAVVLAGLAVALACAGLHAAVAYGVSQRRGELAVRLALGASARSLIVLMLREPVKTTAAGIALGLPAAYAAMQSAGSLLFDVAPFDLLTVSGCAAGLITVGMFAAVWPACRATRIDPAASLRK